MAHQARSLDTLLAEVNRAAPNRSKASDGGIGDPRHRKTKSDHNPNGAGVWRARDFTNDPGDFSAQALAHHVAGMLGKHPALGSGAYVIWNRQIISADRLDEGWRPYSGVNAHTKHVHVSVATAAKGYDSQASWNWPPKVIRNPNLTDAEAAARKALRAPSNQGKAKKRQKIEAALDLLHEAQKL